jgi:hypothetical protein
MIPRGIPAQPSGRSFLPELIERCPVPAADRPPRRGPQIPQPFPPLPLRQRAMAASRSSPIRLGEHKKARCSLPRLADALQRLHGSTVP